MKIASSLLQAMLISVTVASAASAQVNPHAPKLPAAKVPATAQPDTATARTVTPTLNLKAPAAADTVDSAKETLTPTKPVRRYCGLCGMG